MALPVICAVIPAPVTRTPFRLKSWMLLLLIETENGPVCPAAVSTWMPDPLPGNKVVQLLGLISCAPEMVEFETDPEELEKWMPDSGTVHPETVFWLASIARPSIKTSLALTTLMTAWNGKFP